MIIKIGSQFVTGHHYDEYGATVPHLSKEYADAESFPLHYAISLAKTIHAQYSSEPRVYSNYGMGDEKCEWEAGSPYGT